MYLNSRILPLTRSVSRSSRKCYSRILKRGLLSPAPARRGILKHFSSTGHGANWLCLPAAYKQINSADRKKKPHRFKGLTRPSRETEACPRVFARGRERAAAHTGFRCWNPQTPEAFHPALMLRSPFHLMISPGDDFNSLANPR